MAAAIVPNTAPIAEEAIVPIVIELGKRKKKAIRALKRGEGRLMDELAEVLGQVQNNVGADAGRIVPVVMIYREKRKRKGGLLPFSL